MIMSSVFDFSPLGRPSIESATMLSSSTRQIESETASEESGMFKEIAEAEFASNEPPDAPSVRRLMRDELAIAVGKDSSTAKLGDIDTQTSRHEISSRDEMRKNRLMAALMDGDWLGLQVLAVVFNRQKATLDEIAGECECELNRVAVTLSKLTLFGALGTLDALHFECTEEGRLIATNLKLEGTCD